MIRAVHTAVHKNELHVASQTNFVNFTLKGLESNLRNGVRPNYGLDPHPFVTFISKAFDMRLDKCVGSDESIPFFKLPAWQKKDSTAVSLSCGSHVLFKWSPRDIIGLTSTPS